MELEELIMLGACSILKAPAKPGILGAVEAASIQHAVRLSRKVWKETLRSFKEDVDEG